MKTIRIFFLVMLILSACGPATPSVGMIQTAIAQTLTAQPSFILAVTVILPPTNSPLATNTPEPAATLEPTKTSFPTETPEPTDIPLPTETPRPTDTPLPTDTPQPTNTPVPSPTPTQAPQPVVLEGSGDAVVPVDKWEGFAFAHIVSSGTSNFSVVNYDANDQYLDLLVNEIGAYDGYHIIDYVEGETDYFEINANGPWQITLYPFAKEYLHWQEVPGTYQGKSADAFFLWGKEPFTATLNHDGKSNFVVYGIKRGERLDLLVNEIGPYQGTVRLDGSTFGLIVQGDGHWSAVLATR